MNLRAELDNEAAGRSAGLTGAVLVLVAVVLLSVWNPLLFARAHAMLVLTSSVVTLVTWAVIFFLARHRVHTSVLAIAAVVAGAGMAYGAWHQVSTFDTLVVEDTVASPSGRFLAVSACTDFDSPQQCTLAVRTGSGIWQREVEVWAAIEEPAAPIPSATWLSDTALRIDSTAGEHRLSIHPLTLWPSATYCVSPIYCDGLI